MHPEQSEKCSAKPPPRPIGEYCSSDEECSSNNCNKARKTCAGSRDTCELETDCDVGLYCGAGKKCEPLRTENQPCSQSEKCAVNLICSLEVCTVMGSKKKGDSASAPAACETYHIEDDKCQDGPKLVDKDKVCTGGKTTCKYRRANNTEYEDLCKCGMNTEGKSYCSPGRGEFNLRPVTFLIVS